MAAGARFRAPTAMAVVLIALIAAGPAQASPTPTIPADVSAVFAGDALSQAQAVADGLDADFTGATIEVIHEVFRFSTDFIDGRPTTQPVQPTGSWLAGITRGGDALGTLLVRKPGDGPAGWAGASADVPFAAALRTVAATEILIADEPNGAYYALAGSTVRPLNGWARVAFPQAGDISALQQRVVTQYAAKRAQAAAVSGPPRLLVFLSGAGMVLTVGAFGAVVLVRRRRRVVPEP